MVADPGSPEGEGQPCIMLLPNPTQVSPEDMPSLACWRSSQDPLQRKRWLSQSPFPHCHQPHCACHPRPSPASRDEGIPVVPTPPGPLSWTLVNIPQGCRLPTERLAHPLPPSSPRSPCTKSPCPLTHSPHRSNCRGTDNGAVLISTIPGHLRPVSPGARTMQL